MFQSHLCATLKHFNSSIFHIASSQLVALRHLPQTKAHNTAHLLSHIKQFHVGFPARLLLNHFLSNYVTKFFLKNYVRTRHMPHIPLVEPAEYFFPCPLIIHGFKSGTIHGVFIFLKRWCAAIPLDTLVSGPYPNQKINQS